MTVVGVAPIDDPTSRARAGGPGTSHEVESVEERPKKSWLVEFLEAVVPALIIVVLINVFLGQTRRVDGLSMEPSLHDNERIIMEKLSYRFHPPRRGDIVVVRRPERRFDHPLIKRVVALPGETVEIRDGAVFIDGVLIEEPYLDGPTPGFYRPRLVPEGHYFVLGDNRASSNDSRAFGMVPLEDVMGRAWLRYWPPDEMGLLTR